VYKDEFFSDLFSISQVKMRISFGILGLFALCHATTVEPVDEGYETPVDQGTSEIEAPWAPKGAYDGSLRDRAAFLARMLRDDEDEVVAQEPRTPDRQDTTEIEAPWAPNRAYDGSLRDRAAFLALMRRDDDDEAVSQELRTPDRTIQMRDPQTPYRARRMQPQSLIGRAVPLPASSRVLSASAVAPAELVEITPTTTTVSPDQNRPQNKRPRDF
jgi:hypothetical protein